MDSQEASGMSMVGRVLHDSYLITRFIAEGGMGTVYEATHVRLKKKRFAVKVLLPWVAEVAEVYARFRREAEIATELGHPHIVDVLDFNQTEDGRPYMVMEYLEGEDLGQRLRREERMHPAQVVLLMLQVGSGLKAAHEKGIVHRDVKPENIFLVGAPEQPLHAKILDFGISKIQHSKSVITRDQTVIGTPYYMSPEQARGSVNNIDHTTDIFALGAICYQAISGNPPFDAPTIPGVMYQVCHEEPPPLSDLLSNMPPGVDVVLARALTKDKLNRYQSAEEFAKELAMAFSMLPAVSYTPLQVVSTANLLAGTPGPAPEQRLAPATGPHHPAKVTTLSSGVGEDMGLPTIWRSPKLGLLLGAIAVGLIGIIGGGVLLLGGAPPATSTTKPTAKQKAPRAVAAGRAPGKDKKRAKSAPPRAEGKTASSKDARPTPTPTPSPQVTIAFEVAPAEAEMLLDGKLHPEKKLLLPRSSTKHQLMFRAPGYEIVRRDVVPDHSQTIQIRLEKIEEQDRATPDRSSAKEERPLSRPKEKSLSRDTRRSSAHETPKKKRKGKKHIPIFNDL